MAARIVLGVQRLQTIHQKSTTVSPAIRQHNWSSSGARPFAISLIETEYGQEIQQATEVAKNNRVILPSNRKNTGNSLYGRAEDLLGRIRQSRSPSHRNSGESPPPSPPQTPLSSALRVTQPHTASLDKVSREHLREQDCPPYIISPHNKYKVCWDSLVAIMIAYSVLVIPWRIGFGQEATGAAFVLDVIMDICFGVDILMTFFTGYLNEHDVCVMNPGKIAWKYLTGFFVIDFVSVLPIDHIVAASNPGGGASGSARITRVLRLVRLMKLARLFRLKRLTTLLEEKVNINAQMLGMMKVIGQVIFLIHLLACICYWLAMPVCPDGSDAPCDMDLSDEDRPWSTWVLMFYVDRMNVGSRYLASFHLVTATLIAVGYGEVYPANEEERIFSVVCQLIGAIVFGFILSAVTTLIESTSPRDVEEKNRKVQIKEWLQGRDLPLALRHRVWNHFTYVMTQKSMFKDEPEILEHLPTQLRLKLVEQMQAEYVHRLAHLFANEDRCLLAELAMLLRPSQTVQNECIIEAGEPATDVFFVKTGRIEGVLEDDTADDVEILFAISGALTKEKMPLSPKLRAMSGAKAAAPAGERASMGSDGRHSRDDREKPLSRSQTWCPTDSRPQSEAEPAPPPTTTRRMSADAALRMGSLSSKESIGLQDFVLCAIYGESEIFGEFSINPVRLQGGVSRSEVLALCKDELQRVFLQYPEAAERYEERLRDAQWALFEAATSQEWVGGSGTIFNGVCRRRMKSRVVFGGRALPVRDLPNDVFTPFGEGENNETMDPVFPTRWQRGSEKPEIANQTEQDVLRRGIIPPTHPHKVKWDFFIGILILYSVMIIPYRFGFDVDPGGFEIGLDILVDVFFVVDMIFTFRCAFIDADGVRNTVPAEIRRQYLHGWFIVDFLSTFPLDWILESIVPDSRSNGRAIKLIRIARLIRLLKLMRIFKLSKLLDLANSSVEISPLLIRMTSLCVKVCFLAHFVGCFWFYLTSVKIADEACASGRFFCKYGEPSTTWLDELGPDSDIDTNFKKYIVTLYWVFTTMTTVGYGDITPTNDLERVYAIVVMIFGATVFGYIIGSIAELSNGRQDAMSSNLCVLRSFCEERLLNQRTQKEVQRHYAFWYQEMTPLHDEPGLLSELPPSLRKEVILYVHQNAIQSVAIFHRQLPDWFVATMVRLLEPQAFDPGADIIGPEEAAVYQDIVFVYEGVCEVYRPSLRREASRGPNKAASRSAAFRNSAGVMNKRRRARLRRKMQAASGEFEEGEFSEDDSDFDSDLEGEHDDVVEVLPPGRVFGFEPLLLQALERPHHGGGSRLSTRRPNICLRCGWDEPCFLFALRYAMLAEIYAMQQDLGYFIQEVLADCFIRQARMYGKDVSRRLSQTSGIRNSRRSGGEAGDEMNQERRREPSSRVSPIDGPPEPPGCMPGYESESGSHDTQPARGRRSGSKAEGRSRSSDSALPSRARGKFSEGDEPHHPLAPRSRSWAAEEQDQVQDMRITGEAPSVGQIGSSSSSSGASMHVAPLREAARAESAADERARRPMADASDARPASPASPMAGPGEAPARSVSPDHSVSPRMKLSSEALEKLERRSRAILLGRPQEDDLTLRDFSPPVATMSDAATSTGDQAAAADALEKAAASAASSVDATANIARGLSSSASACSDSRLLS